MEALNTSLGKIYFYIKDSVIFDIKGYDNGDVCAKKGVPATTTDPKEVKVPSFVVKDLATSSDTTYFLTNFIADGDSYVNNAFKKHNDTTADAISIYKYFENRCEETVKAAIKNYPKEELSFFNENKKLIGIPPFMFKNNGYTVSSEITQIDLNANFDTWKKEVVQQEAWNAANYRANDFNYEVTSNIDDLTVAKI